MPEKQRSLHALLVEEPGVRIPPWVAVLGDCDLLGEGTVEVSPDAPEDSRTEKLRYEPTRGYD